MLSNLQMNIEIINRAIKGGSIMTAYKILSALLLILIAISNSGCSYFARFSPPVAQEVNVILKENDFKIQNTNLCGQASVFYLFGMIPLGDERLFSRALADLYSQVEGGVIGKSCQLTNWGLDYTKYNFIIGTYNEALFRADLLVYNK